MIITLSSAIIKVFGNIIYNIQINQFKIDGLAIRRKCVGTR